MADEAKKATARKRLRKGFSTGTAATAAARAALRFLLSGETSQSVSVRLPVGYFLPVPIARLEQEGQWAVATVVKDGGDDPDVTHHAEILAAVTLECSCGKTEPPRLGREETCGDGEPRSGVFLRGGMGVGHVTKPGLPVKPGEPAINPVPRLMMVENLYEELVRTGFPGCRNQDTAAVPEGSAAPPVFLAFPSNGVFPPGRTTRVHVEIRVPKGEEIARHTLNPRLGVVGGISILGTTGLVKPFSHEAYEETIQAGLSVAAGAGCEAVVLSTGGKSEKFAQGLLTGYAAECFVEIADFFAFGVQEAVRLGFRRIVHSVFFGKAVKMAQGHPYTHAHRVALDLEPLSRLALERGYDKDFAGELTRCNTARHALELLQERCALDVVQEVAQRAADQSRKLAGPGVAVRVLVFDYHGTLLTDTGEGAP